MVESCAIKFNSSGSQTHFAERIDRQLLLAAAIIVVCGSRGIQRNGGLFGTKGDSTSTMCNEIFIDVALCDNSTTDAEVAARAATWCHSPCVAWLVMGAALRLRR